MDVGGRVVEVGAGGEKVDVGGRGIDASVGIKRVLVDAGVPGGRLAVVQEISKTRMIQSAEAGFINTNKLPRGDCHVGLRPPRNDM
jgi:hypothetical protein